MFEMMQKMMAQMKPMMSNTQAQDFPFGMMAPCMKMMEMNFAKGETASAQGQADSPDRQTTDDAAPPPS